MIEINPASHALLGQDDFKNALFERGYDRAFGQRLFNLIARGAAQITPDRTADSLLYYETDRAGEQELLISLPNVAGHLSEVGDIPQLGSAMVEATTRLVDPYLESH